MPFSTMNAVMPRAPPCGSVFAYTTSVSASGPLVIHIFEPFSTKASPRRSARRRIDTTSEPAPGSLIASAPTCSPVISFGRYLRRCASLPFLRIWLTHRFEWAP